jgi:hypothetical protein
MTELAKIVRDRLARTPSGASGGDHPDANLLAGYVERSLTSRERSVVLGHLAQCAECREQVSVALPKLEAEMAGTGAGVARGWLRWPALRWGLLVASLVIMGTVALVRRPPTRHMGPASPSNAAPSPLPSDVTVGAAPSKTARRTSPQETALLKGKLQGKELASSVNPGLEKAVPSREQVAQAQSKQKVQAYEAPEAEGFRTGPNAINGGSSNQTSNAAVAQAIPPPAASAPVAPTQGQPAPQALDLLPSPQPKQAENSRASEEDKSMSAGEAGGGGAAPSPAAKAPRQLAGHFAVAPQPHQAALAKGASAPAGSLTTSSALVSSLPAADWSISASGKVQRSRDGRKTWEELDVDKNVVFRVVFAVGPDVWLGGSKGALYHTTDGGQHWTRVSIATGSTTVTDDVIRIDFKDAQHGTVGTAAGETWATLDAGQNWRKQ